MKPHADIRHVAVPLDGSHFAEHALPHAVAVAKRAGATLTLVSVATLPFSSPQVRGVRLFEQDLVRRTEAAHGAYLVECARRVRERYALECNVAVLVGSVLECLAQFVASADVDLVVMTTHGGGSPNVSWMGSVTDRMVRESVAPILLVRPSSATDALSEAPAPRRMLVASDGSNVAERVLDSAVRMARTFDADLVLFAAVTGGAAPLVPRRSSEPDWQASEEDYLRRRLDEMAARAGEDGAVVTVLVERHQHAVTAISDAAARVGADVVAMATHGRGGVGRFFLGSVADKVLRTCSTPLLFVGPHA